MRTKHYFSDDPIKINAIESNLNSAKKVILKFHESAKIILLPFQEIEEKQKINKSSENQKDTRDIKVSYSFLQIIYIMYC